MTRRVDGWTRDLGRTPWQDTYSTLRLRNPEDAEEVVSDTLTLGCDLTRPAPWVLPPATVSSVRTYLG